MPSFLALDIETIPDLTVWQPPVEETEPEKIRLKDSKAPSKGELEFLAAALDRISSPEAKLHSSDAEKAKDIALRSEKTDDATRFDSYIKVEEKKDVFPPLMAHQPIVIGCVWLDSNLGTKDVGVVGRGALHNDEHKLLSGWAEFMAKERPLIVTWNGRTFDMPVLSLRSLRHGVPLPWYFDDKNYRYRYTEDAHCDLMDAITDYGAAGRGGFKLDDIAKLIGLPGKHDDVDGSQVKAMYEAGKIADIERYCLTDCIQTALVFMRWRYLKGKMNLEMYRGSVVTMLDHLENHKINFNSFLSKIDRKQLLLGNMSGKES